MNKSLAYFFTLILLLGAASFPAERLLFEFNSESFEATVISIHKEKVVTGTLPGITDAESAAKGDFGGSREIDNQYVIIEYTDNSKMVQQAKLYYAHDVKIGDSIKVFKSLANTEKLRADESWFSTIIPSLVCILLIGCIFAFSS